MTYDDEIKVLGPEPPTAEKSVAWWLSVFGIFRKHIRSALIYGNPGSNDQEIIDEAIRVRQEVTRLRTLVSLYAKIPFPVHDYMTPEQWEQVCLLCAEEGTNPWAPNYKGP